MEQARLPGGRHLGQDLRQPDEACSTSGHNPDSAKVGRAHQMRTMPVTPTSRREGAPPAGPERFESGGAAVEGVAIATAYPIDACGCGSRLPSVYCHTIRPVASGFPSAGMVAVGDHSQQSQSPIGRIAQVFLDSAEFR
jgi:hypothetical protein